MKRLYTYLSKKLAEQGTIKYEDIEVCTYGMETFVFSCFEIFSVLLISLLVKNFFATVIFFVSFVPLRMYAGGYHSETKKGCYMVMLVVYLIFTLSLRFSPKNHIQLIEIIISSFTSFMVLRFAPIVNYKKRVNEIEKKNYKKIALKIICVQSIVVLFFVIVYPYNIYGLAFSLGQLTVAVSMLAVVVKNKKKGGGLNEKNERNA
ncbi:MAG: accessory gene regulator B family protein [Clostridia bacterium]|nr:accessory gene regulator B family protein [Clostridia bacterium]